MNTLHAIKNNYISTPGKYVRQIKKNNNYIHIRKKQIKSGSNRNKSTSTAKNKAKQKNISTDDTFNFKENTINNNNINFMRNPFHQINNTYIKTNKHKITQHKINLKKNNIYDLNSNGQSTNPLLNISNTFISFNMYPKYYLDPKKQLSSPKILPESQKTLKYTNKNNSNMKIAKNKKITPTSNNNNHIRKNTSPRLESPSKKNELNNFMKIQQNIFNNMENQKLFFYTNTEYDQNLEFSKNMNIGNIQNLKNKIINKKYKATCKDITSTNKIYKWKTNINQNRNFNISNSKNLSNTISPSNEKKYNNKISFNIINKKFLQYNKLNQNNLNNNDNSRKNKNCLSNYVINNDNNNSNKKNKDLEINGPSQDFHFLKKNDMINVSEKIHFNTITNKDLTTKIGINTKQNKK